MQIFRENETATIALSRYHEWLERDERLRDILSIANLDSWPVVHVSTEKLMGVFAKTLRENMRYEEMEIIFDA